MKKSDLRSGMVVERRDGERFLLVDFGAEIVGVNGNSCWGLDYTQENMSSVNDAKRDIVKVFEAEVGTLNWMLDEREDMPICNRSDEKEITSDEAFRILRKHYGCEVKIIE